MLAQDWMDVLTVVGIALGFVMFCLAVLNPSNQENFVAALPIVGIVCVAVVFLMFPMGVATLMAVATVLAQFFGVFRS